MFNTVRAVSFFGVEWQTATSLAVDRVAAWSEFFEGDHE
jgi:hypothetical protein